MFLTKRVQTYLLKNICIFRLYFFILLEKNVHILSFIDTKISINFSHYAYHTCKDSMNACMQSFYTASNFLKNESNSNSKDF